MNEWKIDYSSGNTVYLVLVDDATGNYVIGTSTEIYNVSDWLSYAISMPDSTGMGLYIASQPAVPAGTYTGTAYKQLGSQPDPTDTEIAFGTINWNGSSELEGPVSIIPIQSYASIADGDAYFSTVLYADDWENATNSDKQKSLNRAHEFIEQYCYLGERSTITQLNEWPRANLLVQGTEGNLEISKTLVPDDIIKAEMIIAKVLLGGFDPEQEARNRGISSRRYASVQTHYDNTTIPEYVRAECPSQQAWSLLRRYISLSSSGTVTLRRVN